jgi:hypothetical protein
VYAGLPLPNLYRKRRKEPDEEVNPPLALARNRAPSIRYVYRADLTAHT